MPLWSAGVDGDCDNYSSLCLLGYDMVAINTLVFSVSARTVTMGTKTAEKVHLFFYIMISWFNDLPCGRQYCFYGFRWKVLLQCTP